MIKLKGGDDKHSIMNQAAKRMGLPTANTAKTSQSHTSPGSHHSQQSSSSSQSAIPSGPTPIAQRLVMPSAMKNLNGNDKKKDGKDWSSKSNRINLGAPVYIQSKSHQSNYLDDEENTNFNDQPKHKIGDVTQHSDDENDSDNENDFNDTNSEESRVLASLRASRLNELKKLASKQQEWLALGHGSYTNISERASHEPLTINGLLLISFRFW